MPEISLVGFVSAICPTCIDRHFPRRLWCQVL